MRLRIILSLLLALCVATSVEAQIIGGGVLSGGGGNLPAKLQPALWLDAGDGWCWQDAAAGFVATDKSYLAMGTNWNPGTKDIGISLWVYADTSVATMTLFCTGGTADGQDGVVLQLDSSGNVIVGFNDSVEAARLTATYTTALADDTWYHLFWHCDRSGLAKLYVNGEPDDVTLDISTHDGSLGATGGRLGADLTPNTYLDGRLDSVMTFELADMSAVVADLVAWCYNAGAGRLGEDITDTQKTAWGAVSCWDLTGSPWSDSWGSNDLAFVAAELVTNGTFTGNSTGWTEGAGWSYGTNNEAGTAAEADLAQSTVVPTVGKLYSTSFVTAITGGTVRLNLGGVNGTTRSTSATHAETIRATSTASLVIDPVTAYTGTIDTVSVKAAEILPVAGIVRGLSQDSNFATQLNGTSQYFTYAGTEFNPGIADFAIGFSFYLDRIPTAGSLATIVSMGTAGNDLDYVWIYVDANGKLGMLFNDSTAAVSFASTNLITVGGWYTGVINFNRINKATAYINGSSTNWGSTSIAAKSTSVDPGSLCIGQYAFVSTARYFPGRIDNVFYTNRLLTASEITWLHNNGEWRQWSELGVAGTDGEALTSDVVKGFWEFDDKASLGDDSTANNLDLTPVGTPTQTTGINYTEGQVSYWMDRSGNGRHATQTTLAKYPAYVTVGGPGGKPAVMFDGVDDYLSSTFTLAQPYTVALVGKFGGNSQVMIDGVSADAFLWRSAAGKAEFNAGSAITGADDDADWHVYFIEVNGASSTLGIDGTDTAGNAGSNNPGGITLGMARNGSSYPLDGRITAVIPYAKVLSASEKAAAIAWLQSFYQLAP